MPSSHWAGESVNQMIDRGILSGYPDGTFKGYNTVNRYELALYLYRFSRYIESHSNFAIAAPLTKEDFSSKDAQISQLTDEVRTLKNQVNDLKTEMQQFYQFVFLVHSASQIVQQSKISTFNITR